MARVTPPPHRRQQITFPPYLCINEQHVNKLLIDPLNIQQVMNRLLADPRSTELCINTQLVNRLSIDQLNNQQVVNRLLTDKLLF